MHGLANMRMSWASIWAPPTRSWPTWRWTIRGAARELQHSATHRRRHDRVAHAPAVVPVSGASAGTAAGRSICPGPRAARFAVGEMARRQAAEVPDRTVGAAKSWLCHSRGGSPAADLALERSGRSAEDVAGHCRRSDIWNIWWRRGTRRFPTRRSPSSIVVLTVPASFDASARELTREAALGGRLAGGLRAARRAAGGGLCLARPTRAIAGGSSWRSATRCWSATSAAAPPT